MSIVAQEIPLRVDGGSESTATPSTRVRPADRVPPATVANGRMGGLLARLLSVQLASRVLSGLSILASIWLFAPSEFVQFGVLLAVLTLASSIQFLRYEYTIAAARGPAELRSALLLTAAVGIAVWVGMSCLTGLALAFDVVGPEMAGLFLFALLGRGACRILGRLAIRDGEFDLLGKSSLACSGSQPFVVVLAYWLDANGSVAMALSDICANFVVCLLIGSHYRKKMGQFSLNPHDIRLMRRMASGWSTLPLANLPTTLLAAIFATVPVMAVLNMVHADLAGHIALAFRLIDVPSQVLAAAISPIAMNRFARARGERRSYRDPELAFWLIAAVTAVFGGISLASLVIDPWLAGTSWQGVATYVPLVALFQGGIAMTLPLLEIGGMQHSQRRLLLLLSLSVSGVGLIVLTFRDWQTALLGFGLLAVCQAACLLSPLLGKSPQASVLRADRFERRVVGAE